MSHHYLLFRSVPPHLTLPGKTTFLNGILREGGIEEVTGIEVIGRAGKRELMERAG